MRGFFARRRTLAIIAALVVAFVAFEVGVRLLQPDAVSYQIQKFPGRGQYSVVSGTITDPATVARWRAAVIAKPAEPLASSYLRWLWLNIDCGGPLVEFATYTFTWHGLPVEVVSRAPATCGEPFQVSSGGIPDWNAYLIDPLPQP